jgi:hypothetical protein
MAAPLYDPWLFMAPFISRRPAAASRHGSAPARQIARPARPNQPARSPVRNSRTGFSDKVDHRPNRLGETGWREIAFVGVRVTAFVLSAGGVAYILASRFM